MNTWIILFWFIGHSPVRNVGDVYVLKPQIQYSQHWDCVQQAHALTRKNPDFLFYCEKINK